MAGPTLQVALVLEQHLGHRTYADNLRANAPDDPGVSFSWIPVTYEAELPAPLRFLPGRVRAPLSARREVRDGLRRAGNDVTVFNTQVPAALGGGRIRRTPYVVVTDVTPIQYDRMAAGYGHRPDRFAPTRWWKHRVNRGVFGGAAYCVGWSSWVTDSLVTDYGVDPERSVVVSPGVDLARWARPGERSSSDRVRLLFVGGDFERKGGRRLIEAFAALPDNCELVLVTRSAPRGRFGDLASRITVVDDLQPNDGRLIALYHAADVFVLPSEAETFGIAAVEANAAGLPVVASDVGGLPDIVDDGVTGLLVPPGSGQELESALRALVTDPVRRHRMGVAARARAEDRFDAAVNVRRLLDLARCAAGREPAPSTSG